ncbi:hypothetical protein MMC25_007165 [Agyrium rufum]|nr:hypothetical protein [Agyrium rufum]
MTRMDLVQENVVVIDEGRPNKLAYGIISGPYDRPRGGRNQRHRSRSPPMIDRYQPGDRGDRGPYDDGYPPRDYPPRREERRRNASPPNIDRYVPGQDTEPVQIRTNPLPPPITLDFQVGFTWFGEWWRAEQAIKEDKERARNGGRRPVERMKSDKEQKEEREKEHAQIQAAYDIYKEELQVKMAKTFVQLHKSEEWFKERYVSEIQTPIRQKLMDFRRAALNQWDNDLDSGVFDEFSLEGIYKSESNGAGGVVEREEGEAVAAAEVLGVGDLVPSRGGDIRDDSALQPALLIKTLAPMVSREKIEAFCKEHLGENDGGFKWLSLSDPNPQKKCHRIGWIMLHPESEVAPPVDRGDGRDEENDEDMEVSNQTNENKSLLTTSEKALDAINGKTIHDEIRGDFTCHVGVHSPPRELRKKALWDLFSAPERIERDLSLAERIITKYDQEMGEDVGGLAKIQSRIEDLRSKGLLQSASSASKKFKKEGDAIAMEDVEEGAADEDDEDEGAFDDETDDEDLLVKKKTLDLIIEYLRRVHNFCMFCVFESDSVHELIRKCAGGHLRRPRASLSTLAKLAGKASAAGEPFPTKRRDSNANAEEGEKVESPVGDKKFRFRGGKGPDQQLQRAFNWVKTYEEKLLQILEPGNVDLKKIGGKPVEEGLDEELKKYVKQEDESKFRCKVPDCTKLFKGETFWRKHVEKRHPEWFNNIKQDLVLVNNYVLDPSHIAPSRSDANSNGHFPMTNPGMHGGTPRGFNLGQMPGAGMPGMSPGFGPPGMNGAGMSPFPSFGNHTVQMPGNWMAGGQPMMSPGGMMGANGGVAGPDGMMHSAGPIRRGRGGSFGGVNRSGGPYDRRQPRYGQGGGGQNMRNGSIGMMGGGMMGGPMNGRMMGGPGGMPMSMGMGMGVGKWGDGVGAQTVGPKEATQGRVLKSYEDLDAVGSGGAGSGGGELNY